MYTGSIEVIQAALREYLVARGYVPPTQHLRISPVWIGSGFSDVSVDHDRFFAEG